MNRSQLFAALAASLLAMPAVADIIDVPDPVADKIRNPTTNQWESMFTFFVGGAASGAPGWGTIDKKTIQGPREFTADETPVNWTFASATKTGPLGEPDEDFINVPFCIIVGLKEMTILGDVYKGLPPGFTVSDGCVITLFGGEFALTATSIPDLDAPGALPDMIPDGAGVIDLDWSSLNNILAPDRQGNYWLLCANLPIDALCPAPGAAAPLLVCALLTARRRRSC